MVFNRAPAERQLQACGILFGSVEERPAVDAEPDPHAVGDEVALEHPSVIGDQSRQLMLITVQDRRPSEASQSDVRTRSQFGVGIWCVSTNAHA